MAESCFFSRKNRRARAQTEVRDGEPRVEGEIPGGRTRVSLRTSGRPSSAGGHCVQNKKAKLREELEEVEYTKKQPSMDGDFFVFTCYCPTCVVSVNESSIVPSTPL